MSAYMWICFPFFQSMKLSFSERVSYQCVWKMAFALLDVLYICCNHCAFLFLFSSPCVVQVSGGECPAFHSMPFRNSLYSLYFCICGLILYTVYLYLTSLSKRDMGNGVYYRQTFRFLRVWWKYRHTVLLFGISTGRLKNFSCHSFVL